MIFNCGYHDLNVCYCGRPIKQNKYISSYKIRLLQFLVILLFLIMNGNVYLPPYSSYCQICICKRQFFYLLKLQPALQNVLKMHIKVRKHKPIS